MALLAVSIGTSGETIPKNLRLEDPVKNDISSGSTCEGTVLSNYNPSDRLLSDLLYKGYRNVCKDN